MANTCEFLIFATCIAFLHMVNGQQGQFSQQAFSWDNTLAGQSQQEFGQGGPSGLGQSGFQGSQGFSPQNSGFPGQTGPLGSQGFNPQSTGFPGQTGPLGSQGFNPQNSGFPGQTGPLGSQGFNPQNSGFSGQTGALGSQGFNPQNSGFPSQTGSLGSQGFNPQNSGFPGQTGPLGSEGFNPQNSGFSGGPFTTATQQTNFGQIPFYAYQFMPMSDGFQGIFPQQGTNMLYPWQMSGQFGYFPMSNFQGTFQQGSQFPFSMSNPLSQMGNVGGSPWQIHYPWMFQFNSQGFQNGFTQEPFGSNSLPQLGLSSTSNNNFGFNPGFQSNSQGNFDFGIGPNSRGSSNSQSTFRR